MHITATMPHGRLRAFMAQRVCFDGAVMLRAEAYRLVAETTKDWAALDHVIELPAEELLDVSEHPDIQPRLI